MPGRFSPVVHLLDDLVGDPGDRLLRHRRAVDLGEVRRGSNVPARSRGTSISTWPVASVSTVLARVPLRMLPDPAPAGSCFS